jgi:hypothetical protein
VKAVKQTTQHRVYGVLKLSDKPMTAYEVAICLGRPKQTVASHLKALSRGNFVVCHKDEKATNALLFSAAEEYKKSNLLPPNKTIDPSKFEVSPARAFSPAPSSGVMAISRSKSGVAPFKPYVPPKKPFFVPSGRVMHTSGQSYPQGDK